MTDKPIDVVAASQTATTGGRKFDGGKLRYGLLPPLAHEENVKVLTFGAQKYEPDNWRRVPDGINRYFDAAQRHLWAWKQGETYDKETGLHHMAHAICCLQFICDLELTERDKQAAEPSNPTGVTGVTGFIPGGISGTTIPGVPTGVVYRADHDSRGWQPR